MEITTLFHLKGVCYILDSFTMPENMVEASLHIKFNASRPLIFYSLFPGKKMFFSVFHPTESLEGKRVEGAAMFKLNIIPKVTSLIPNPSYCKAVDNNIVSVAKAQKEYDIW